ncbi:MAG: phosphatase PAP2 family protein [Gemmatimonadaceae bacterium]
MRTNRGFICALVCAMVAAQGECLSAQAPALIRHRDAIIGLGVAALTAVTMSVDESVARDLQGSSVQTNGGLKGTANVFNTIGFPGSVVLSASTYFFGLAKHSRPIASLGMHTGEAIVFGGGLAEGLQMTIGRARPQRDVNDHDDFIVGKGFGNEDYTSFPSAHTTVAFATATAVSREVGRSWPGASKYVTPISYSVATLVGLSRMYKNKHWASDVVGSAGLGIYSAVLFDRYNVAHPGNIFERTFLPKSIMQTRSGIALVWSI